MAARGSRLVISPAAYPSTDAHWWDRLYPATALLNGQWWVLTNQAGTHGSFSILGGSKIVSPLGETVAEAPRAPGDGTRDAATLVAEIAFRRELERADAELQEMRETRRPDIYETEATR
jgi:predicted amidohydrolase